MKHPKTLILTDTPEHARHQHLADLLAAYRSRPFPPGVYNVIVKQVVAGCD